MGGKTIIVWSAEKDSCASLKPYLGSERILLEAQELKDVGIALRQGDVAAILVDTKKMMEQGEELVRMAYYAKSDLPVVLLGSTLSAECFWLLRMHGLSAAISPKTPLSAEHVRIFFDHLLGYPAGFSLGQYFPSEQRIPHQIITTIAQRLQVFDRISHDFEGCPYVQPHDLHLILEEVLNNAISHAFGLRTDDKASNPDQPFQKHGEIRLDWAVSDNLSALAVTDNQGLLSQKDVWDRFFRQTSLTGLLDTNGRGLYLAHLLSRQVLVTITPGSRTQIAVFFSQNLEKDEEKPVSIRVIKPVLLRA